MREYPKGSVCVVISGYDEFIAKECTILEGLAEREGVDKSGKATFGVRYLVTVQGYGDKQFTAVHEQLRLKRMPPDERFEQFLEKVKTPVGQPEEELV
jgi:hypothetical protein